MDMTIDIVAVRSLKFCASRDDWPLGGRMTKNAAVAVEHVEISS